MPDRFAIYYAPGRDSRLWSLAAQWLERDATGSPVQPSQVPGVTRDDRLRLSASARKYGFHATLKAPMVLAHGVTRGALESALEDFAARESMVPLGHLVIAELDGFLALVPERKSEAITGFAARVVDAFDPFRAPLDPEDRARRLGAPLTPRQVELLDRYGYPYVLEQFQFHMTLTDRLSREHLPMFTRAAEDWFADAIAEPIVLDRLTLFHQPDGGGPFERIADYPLRTESQT